MSDTKPLPAQDVGSGALLAAWEVWCVPTAINTFSKPRKVGGPYATREDAADAKWFDEQDEPAPDKYEYYRWEIRQFTANPGDEPRPAQQNQTPTA